jgi:tetratricopeptide (TPR) repeat protein
MEAPRLPGPSAAPALAEALAAPDSPAGKKPRRRWIWAGGAVMMLCLCMGTALVLSAGEDQNAATPSPAGVLETASVPPLPAIDSAFATVQSNDGDPEAHRRLAEALVASNRKREAVKELERAAELYMAQGHHLQAATVLMEALRFSGGEVSDPELVERMTQSLFLGAADPGAADVIAAAQQAFPRREELRIFEARARLLSGDTAKAEALLKPVLETNPQNPLGQAVMVEIHLARAEYARAQALVGGLLGRPGLPDWLIAHLTNLQQSIPSQN